MLLEDVAILVVDDVNSMRLQIQELLKHFGFSKVFLAANGQEAKQVLVTEKVHLVLCDWVMTPINGMELLQYVRSHLDLGHLAFVMVTAENTKEKVIEAIKGGVDDYLIKPLTPAQIQSKVYGVLLKKKIL